MKKTIITLLALAGMATADEVFNLSTAGTPDKSDSVSVTNQGVQCSASNWKTKGYAGYSFGESITLSAPEDVLDFSFTATRPSLIHDKENVEKSLTFLTFALTGRSGDNTQAIVIGHGNSNDYEATAAELQIGISDSVGEHGYTFEGSKAPWTVSASSELEGGMPFGTTTVSGQIAWDATDNLFTLTLNSSALTNNATLKFDLGKSVTVDGVVLSVYGVDTPTITAASVSATIVPEPTTATLSLLALAGLAARRRRR